MTDLQNIAMCITDHSNTIRSAERGIVETLRQLHNAGATVVAYDDCNDRPIMLAVYLAGEATDDVDAALITVELPSYCRDELDFAVEA